MSIEDDKTIHSLFEWMKREDKFPIERRFVKRTLELDRECKGSLLPRKPNGEIHLELFYVAVKSVVGSTPPPEIERSYKEEELRHPYPVQIEKRSVH